MSKQTDPIEPAESPASTVAPTSNIAAEPAPVAGTVPSLASAPRVPRTVTLPVLPLAIVGGVIAAVLFFGGGMAVGVGIGSHDRGPGSAQRFQQGEMGRQGGMGSNGHRMNNGFGFGNPGNPNGNSNRVPNGNGNRNGFGPSPQPVPQAPSAPSTGAPKIG